MNTWRAVFRVAVLLGASGLLGCGVVDWAGERIARSEDALCGDFPCAPKDNFYTSAVSFVPVDESAIVIPRSAWDAFVAPGGKPLDSSKLAGFQATNKVRSLGARLASIANDPSVGGIAVPIGKMVKDVEISADDILIVVDDPQAFDDQLLSTKYFIAPVGIKGTAAWGIRGGSFGVAPVVALGGGRCCGPVHAAEPIIEFGPTAPGCDGDPVKHCVDWDTSIYGFGELGAVGMAQASGSPVVELNMFSTAGEPVRLAFIAPLGGIPTSVQCGDIKPVCDEGGPLDGASMEGVTVTIPYGPPECGGQSTSYFSPVDPMCTQVMPVALSAFPTSAGGWATTAGMVGGAIFAPPMPRCLPQLRRLPVGR